MPQPLALVVDDEPSVRSYVVSALRREEFRTLEAENGLEALDLVRSLGDKLTLLLSDIKMPKMNGHALATAVAREFPTIAILLMSGYADTPRAGFSFIAKPFDAAKLRAAVNDVLKRGAKPR